MLIAVYRVRIQRRDTKGYYMKFKEISKRYNLNQEEFAMFMFKQTQIAVKGFNGDVISDDEVEAAVELFKKANKEKLQIVEEKNKRDIDKQKALASMLITSGFSFDGYKITKYSGYISGDDAMEIPRSGWLFTTNNSQNLTDALAKIRIQALRELKEAAYDLGCNAVVGVDFDYLTLEPEHGSGLYNGVPGAGTVYEPYIICVTANGNAVVIEKE